MPAASPPSPEASGAAPPAGGRFWTRWVYLVVFGAGLVGFGATAWSRLGARSVDPHFVWQADAWLHGRLDIDRLPPGADDPLILYTLETDRGEVRAWKPPGQNAYRGLDGEPIPGAGVRVVATHYYVAFPPFPSLLLVPQAAVFGKQASDVHLTIVIAALALVLLLATLRRLAAVGLSRRGPVDDLWLTAAFGFGTVLFVASVQGRVWYTAHVVGVALALGYAWASIGARRPLVAGVLLGCAAITRTPMAFMFPLFLAEAWRVGGGRAGLAAIARRVAWFAAPVVAIAIAAMVYNHARFGHVTEFGHSYLAIIQQGNIEAHGLMSLHYLGRNLAVTLALVPDIGLTSPYVLINPHGLAVWFTTPLVLLVLWPRDKGPLHRPLWLTVALVAAPGLLYHNSGWFQFGDRFSLDYLAFVFLLIAVGGRRLGWWARALIIAGIAVNLFGAVTFGRDRFPQFYRGEYGVVVRH